MILDPRRTERDKTGWTSTGLVYSVLLLLPLSDYICTDLLVYTCAFYNHHHQSSIINHQSIIVIIIIIIILADSNSRSTTHAIMFNRESVNLPLGETYPQVRSGSIRHPLGIRSGPVRTNFGTKNLNFKNVQFVRKSWG